MAGYVLIKQYPDRERTESGIIILDSVHEKTHKKGEIVSVGAIRKDESVEVEIGDVVLYNKYLGTTIEDDEHNFVIMEQCEILLVVEK